MDSTALFTVILVVVFALVFDFTNGFHDTANAMATAVATGALRPRIAVLLAALLNLVGAFLSTQVALTISSGIIRTDAAGRELITPALVFAGVVGAIVWNVTTWYLGLPSSSSHALFGGLIGAALVGGGIGAIDIGTIVQKVLIPAVLAPVVAGLAAFVGIRIIRGLHRRSEEQAMHRSFRIAQTASSSLVALAHGTSDAQKTMGVITLTFVTVGVQPSGSEPFVWVVLACGLALALGTAMGGWRIMRTMGSRITSVDAPQGFAAETASAATILASSHLGFPLSTTQVVSGSIVGVGLGGRVARVHWRVATRIAAGWLLTLPASALVAALAAWTASTGIAGLVAVGVVAVVVLAGFAVLARRSPVTAATVNAPG